MAERSQIYFHTIAKISHLLADEGDFQSTMNKVLVQMARQTGMKRGMISLYRRDLEQIHVDISYGIPNAPEPISVSYTHLRAHET